MNVIPLQKWQTLPMPDFRGRFFIETLLETLHQNTPPFYRARLMNIISASEEVITSINDYQLDSKNIKNLNNSIKELNSCISTDSIMEEIIKQQITALKNVLNVIKVDNMNNADLKKLKLLCENILSYEQIYFDTLVKKLKNSITESCNLAQKDRITKNIYQLANLYVTYLLYKNYSPKYLYNRIDMFIHINNYKGRSFERQLNTVVSKLNSRVDNYEVYFGLRLLHSDITQLKILNIEFLNDISTIFDQKLVEKSCPKSNVYVLIKVDTTDYISAAIQAKEKLDKVLDLVSFEGLLHEDNLIHNCLTKVTINSTVYTKEAKLYRLMQFITSSTFNRSNLRSIVHFYKSFDDVSIDKIERALHYLRFSKETASLEQKLLNIWIALESIFDKESGSIIENVLNYIPKLYAIKSIHERVKYILDLLIAYKIEIPHAVSYKFSITQTTHFDRTLDLNLFFTIFLDEESMKNIFNHIQEEEHLKYRIMSTYMELSNAENIRKRIDKTAEDVTLQIRRIYVIRNKVTHQAFNGNIKSQIINHLYEYTMTCFDGILEVIQALQPARKISLNDALLSYKLGSEMFYINLKNKTHTLNNQSLTIIPVI